MDRALIEDHLAEAERHVQEGREHVMRQMGLVLELQQDGHDTTEAERLLEQFREMLTLYIADRGSGLN